MRTCSPRELKEKLERADEFLLLDVRSDEELALARVDGCTHIPMPDLDDRMAELEIWKTKEIVVMCHHGIRSLMAQEYLESEGFRRVRNLTGGIDAYAVHGDPSVARY
ncbi:MAG: rhodanese-like domain-containing protein [Candidatus Hydrogenedentes bacterium]|nr:rhodanese-like domain-containing protein [Candidatus Hydrogenedentota bacterium]